MRRIPILLIATAVAAILGTTACGPATPTGTDDGAGTLGTADPTTPVPTDQAGAPTPAPGAEDCFTYDAQVLVSHYEAGVHVVFPDGGPELIRVYGGPGDVVGDKAIEVAKLFDTICYIGRGNSFDSPEFVYEYWRDPTGATASPLLYGSTDCVNYDPSDLEVESLGSGLGWKVSAGSEDLQHFATEADANLGRTAIGLQDLLCYVQTSRPDGEPADITYTFNSGD